MSAKRAKAQSFNLVIVAQSGRLQYEALLFAASLARFSPELLPRLHVAEPQPGDIWPRDPRLSDAVRGYLTDLGAQIVPFEARHFGAAYPQGNKIECLSQMPKGEGFVFFDTDTLITGVVHDLKPDFARPTASMKVCGTWPEPELYGPSYLEIWRALYDRFGLDIGPTLDLSQPEDYWRRFLYFNAGWFLGACPVAFGQRFLNYALSIRDDPPEELACQTLDPWLDQVALPLVVAALGGGRPGPDLAGLDGDLTCHYRALPLLYARETDAVVEVLETVAADKPLRRILRDHEPAKTLIYQNRGRKIRAMFDRNDLPRREQVIRNMIKREGLWLR